MAVILPVGDGGIGIIQKGSPAENRQVYYLLNGPGKGLHSRTFQSDSSHIGMGLIKFCTDVDHILFSPVIIYFRHGWSAFMVPEVVKFRTALFILGTGNDKIAGKVNALICEVDSGQDHNSEAHAIAGVVFPGCCMMDIVITVLV